MRENSSGSKNDMLSGNIIATKQSIGFLTFDGGLV